MDGALRILLTSLCLLRNWLSKLRLTTAQNRQTNAALTKQIVADYSQQKPSTDLSAQPVYMLLIVFMTLSQMVGASVDKKQRIYQYVDDNGQKVFTDRPPHHQNTVEIYPQTVVTTDWVKSPRLKTKAVTKKKTQSSGKTKRTHTDSYCQKTQQTITKLERALTGRLKPEEFDKNKQALKKLRWEFRKKCR